MAVNLHAVAVQRALAEARVANAEWERAEARRQQQAKLVATQADTGTNAGSMNRVAQQLHRLSVHAQSPMARNGAWRTGDAAEDDVMERALAKEMRKKPMAPARPGTLPFDNALTISASEALLGLVVGNKMLVLDDAKIARSKLTIAIKALILKAAALERSDRTGDDIDGMCEYLEYEGGVTVTVKLTRKNDVIQLFYIVGDVVEEIFPVATTTWQF